jgi:pimeloyl-ACP methyl ester carboxylesterase
VLLAARIGTDRSTPSRSRPARSSPVPAVFRWHWSRHAPSCEGRAVTSTSAASERVPRPLRLPPPRRVRHLLWLDALRGASEVISEALSVAGGLPPNSASHPDVSSDAVAWFAPSTMRGAGMMESTTHRPVVGVVFVHGFLSKTKAWQHFTRLIREDRQLNSVRIRLFPYRTSLYSPHPLHRIPSIRDVADSLATYLDDVAGEFDHLVLVSHSQGGLVVQRYLARTLGAGRGSELRRIRRVVMFACPNNGSELLRSARRILLRRNPQNAELHSLNAEVIEAQGVVINRVVNAAENGSSSWRIPIMAYAATSDNVVRPESARSVFPDAGSLPGDHFTIIRPKSPDDGAYTALRRQLLTAIEDAQSPREGASPVQGGTEAGPVSGTKSSEKSVASDTTPGTSPSLPAASSAVFYQFNAASDSSTQYVAQGGTMNVGSPPKDTASDEEHGAR